MSRLDNTICLKSGISTVRYDGTSHAMRAAQHARRARRIPENETPTIFRWGTVLPLLRPNLWSDDADDDDDLPFVSQLVR